MHKLVFATATWARTAEEKAVILESINLLASFSASIVIGDRAGSSFPLREELEKIKGVTVSEGESFDEQRRIAYISAANIGKNIFWLESDKKYFIQNILGEIINYDFDGKIIVPFPDEDSFKNYPSFQIIIEKAINEVAGVYFPFPVHLTYGPMCFPSELVRFVKND